MERVVENKDEIIEILGGMESILNDYTRNNLLNDTQKTQLKNLIGLDDINTINGTQTLPIREQEKHFYIYCNTFNAFYHKLFSQKTSQFLYNFSSSKINFYNCSQLLGQSIQILLQLPQLFQYFVI